MEETLSESKSRRRHLEGELGKPGPRTPSPVHPAARGPRTPPSSEEPEVRRHHGEDSDHGPRTPPAEPSFEGERYVREEGRSRGDRSPSRQHKGPRTPPDSDRYQSPRDAPRWAKDEGEEFRDGHIGVDRRGDHRGERVRPSGTDDPRERSRAEADPRRRGRESDPHPRARAHDGRPREDSRDVEYQHRHDERDDDHQRARPRAEPRDDDYHRRRDERDDEFTRGRGREERELGHDRGRARDLPRRPLDGGAERRWDGRDRDARFPPPTDRCVRHSRAEAMQD